MAASKCISHFLQFILLLLELFLAIKFDMSERRVSLHIKHCKIQAYNMHKFRLYRYLGHGRFVGGSKRKRPNDVVGEKIDMFVALKCTYSAETFRLLVFILQSGKLIF